MYNHQATAHPARYRFKTNIYTAHTGLCNIPEGKQLSRSCRKTVRVCVCVCVCVCVSVLLQLSFIIFGLDFWRASGVTPSPTSFISILFYSSYVYGHITLKTPVLVRSPKLSNVEPGQYLDGWPPGNTRCRRLFPLSFFHQSVYIYIFFLSFIYFF